MKQNLQVVEAEGLQAPEHDRTRKPQRVSLRQTFASLRHPNYRLWFFGQMISLFGTWMQSTAQGYLVYELTHSAAFLGYVGFASGLPTWLFTLYGGVVADRVSRRTLLIITQSVMMVLAFILGILAFFHVVQPWHIVVLAFLLGVANAFDAPARQSFVLEMVSREDLANAIALNATMFNTATAIGPAVAGVTYALFGPTWCFIINGLTFIAVILALLAMKLQPVPRRPRGGSAWADLREGLVYIKTDPAVRTLIGMVAVSSLFGLSFATLVPAWTVRVFHGDATLNGFFQSARGIGALASAMVLASVGHLKFKGKLLTWGSFTFPVLLLIFAASRWLPLSLALIAGVGGSMIMVFNVANALVQTQTPDALRGRVMGVYSLIFLGSMPLGSLWMGAAAQHFGEPAPLVIGAGAALIAAATVYIFVPRIRVLE